MMTATEMTERMQSLGPFFHDILLPNGMRCTPQGDRKEKCERYDKLSRFETLRKYYLPQLDLKGKRVLDVGCNCGGMSLLAERAGADVVGVDSNEKNIARASFIKEVFGLAATFWKMRASELSPGSVGMFDIVLCLGLVYHMTNPARDISAIASVTNGLMMLDTYITNDSRPLWEMFLNHNLAHSNGGKAVVEMRPTRIAINMLLEHEGFSDISEIQLTFDDVFPMYYDGSRTCLLAHKQRISRC